MRHDPPSLEMSGTSTISKAVGARTEADEGENPQRRSRRILGLNTSIPLDTSNLPVVGPPMLTANRGRELRTRSKAVRFWEMINSRSPKGCSTYAGPEGSNPTRSGNLCDPGGYGRARRKGSRPKTPLTLSSDGTPIRSHSPSLTR